MESYTEPAANDICEGYVNSNQTTQEIESNLPVVDSVEIHTTNELGSIATTVGNVFATVGPVFATVASVSATCVSTAFSTSVTASVGPLHAELSPGESAASLTSVTASVGPVHAEVSNGESAASNIVTDSLGRVHLKTPHAGPAVICIGAGMLCGSTSATHCKDLKPHEEVKKEGPSVVIIIANSGPDWNTASLLNAFSS